MTESEGVTPIFDALVQETGLELEREDDGTPVSPSDGEQNDDESDCSP